MGEVLYGSGYVGRRGEVGSDADGAFLGMDMRRSPVQLEPGEVSLSENGRMDGYWQGRKGIVLRSGQLASSSDALRLPFFLLDSPVTVSAASRVDDLVTITATSHGLTLSDTAYVGLSGVGFASVDPNGTWPMTVTGVNTLTFEIPGATGNETYTISGDEVIESVIDDSAVSDILGSCHFSDSSNSLAESILLATPSVCKKVLLGSYTVSDIPYPTGYIASGEVDMIQAFDRVYLFKGGVAALEWRPKGRTISASSVTSNVCTVTVQNHGLATGDTVVLSGLTYSGTNPNGTRTVTAATADTFTFSLTTANETHGVTNGKMVASGFTYVARGTYTQPQTFAVTSANVSVTSGLLTVTVSSNTTIRAGDFVTVYKSEIPEINGGVVGKSFQVVSATSTQITFYVPAGNVSAGGSNLFEFGGRFSVGGGFCHMPAPPWGVYFQRRLWVPFNYTPGGSFGSYTFTDREIRDEIVASDILDGDSYDQLYSQFRITAGVADYTVAMQPFFEDRMIVLNRNSLHVIRGTQGSLSDTVTTELTREVGCLARKSVVNYANAVFFLSDSGVYGIEFQDEYNLRGIQEPLSLKIQPLMDRINKNLASKSVGIYFNNRYWLAVPLDSSPGRNDATGNNAVLIYNILNKGWESIDTYGGGAVKILNFHIAQDEDRNTLYLVSDLGGLHEMDAADVPVDTYSTNVLGDSTTAGVPYELRTRGYSFGNMARKRFSRAQILMESGNQESTVDFAFSSEDPDSGSIDLGSVEDAIGSTLPANEVGTMRFRLGNPRGIYGVLTISADSSGSAPIGRPKIISAGVEGEIHNRQTISQT